MCRATLLMRATAAAFLIGFCPKPAASSSKPSVEFSGPAASSGQLALTSVFKVDCGDGSNWGTGFLDKSGFVVTAFHVVKQCPYPRLRNSTQPAAAATVWASSDALDLALLKPQVKLMQQPFEFEDAKSIPIGVEVVIWGFPEGYAGDTPLLGTGYIAGFDVCQQTRDRIVINGAINHGDSGGPVIDARNGKVIGVSVSKVVPLRDITMVELDAMGSNPSGVQNQFAFKGERMQRSDAQIIADISGDLAHQVQLVVGCAVTIEDVRKFVKDNGG